MNDFIKQKVTDFFSAYPVHTYSKGDMIIFAEDTVPPIYLLEKGLVGQYDIAESGDTVILNTFKPSAFFPVSSALNAIPNRYFFEALASVTVRQAPAADVLDFLRSNPAVVLDLLSRVYRGADGLLRQLMQLKSGTAASRLLLELAIAAERFGTSTKEGLLVQITEAQLAQQTGLARETISRELRVLKEQNLVDITKRGIVLVKPAAQSAGNLL
jgi:CRP-like cAMP-binding protein